MRRAVRRIATAWSAATLVAVLAPAQPGCMLITSPGDFSIVDAGPDTSVMRHDGGGDSTPPACSALHGTSMCGTCIAESCCSSYALCDDSTSCTALLECASGDTSCVKDNSRGARLATAFLDCTSKRCPICDEAGVGDPCGAGGVTCAKGLTCTGVSCTRSCAGDADCAGLYMNGENSSGGQNRCAIDGESAAVCFPGCGSSSDCAMFPGTTCLPAEASSGGMTNVCGPPESDAGEEAGPTEGGSDAALTDARRDTAPKDAHEP